MDLIELKNKRKVLDVQRDVLNTKIKMAELIEQINNFDIVRVAVHFTDGGTLAFPLNSSSEVGNLKGALLGILKERMKKK